MRTLLLKSLFARPVTIAAPDADGAALEELGRALAARGRRLFGRSITIREVDAGSCNGCELEIHALNNAIYDVERFGLRFAASPRHADVLLVTGAGTVGMNGPLRTTYEGMPDPKVVIVVGADAVSGGLLSDRLSGVAGSVPVDVWVPGSPPSPFALLNALLIATGRLVPGARR
jgi:Ni,Fe-hydrogenase III small subunit